MSKITVTGQLTLTGGQLTAKETPPAPPPAGYALWAWGDGESGKLGLGNTTSYSSPVQVSALTDWANVESAALHSHAIKTDGTLWTWGRNSGGYLGDGTVIDRSSPVQIGNLTDWSSISSGMDAYAHSLAVKTDNTLWAWGRGFNFGQLGQGVTVSRSSPVQIGGLTDWASVSVGSGWSVAIKTDGTLWAWGANSLGYLADNTTINKSSPVQIGALTDWASIKAGTNHNLAVKTDGTLWAWGFNSAGRLGDGTSITRSSPVQIGSLTDWSNVDGGQRHSLAVKTDGTLWAWGDNSPNGPLGDGTIIDKNSPVQIGALTDWAGVYAGRKLSLARKTDGTLWAWGRNNLGQLGDGTVINRSSPVQIGSLTDWTSASLSSYHSLALK